MASEVNNILFKLQADTAQLRSEFAKLNTGIQTIQKNTKETESGFRGLKTSIAGAAAAFGGISIAASSIDFAKGAIKAVADYENVQISLETFLGSATAAKDLFKELEQFSIKTPFTPEQVNNAAKALLAFGEPVEGLQTTLTKIGDVASATGKDFNELSVIYGKARVQGTLFAEDINQLTEAGVPIIQLFAEQLGVSSDQVKKLGSEGKISFSNLEQAFTTLTSEGGRFFGLTEKLSQSTSGRLSTLEGNWTELQRTVGQGVLPIFEALTEAAIGLIAALGRVPSFIEENRRVFILLAGAVGVYIAAQNAALISQLKYEIGFKRLLIQEKLDIAIKRLKAFWTATNTVATNAATGATVANTVATRAAAVATAAWNAALKLNPVGLVIAGITALLVLFSDYIFGVDEAVDATEQLSISQQALVDLQTQTNQAVAEETVELNRLFGALKNSNAGSTERLELIKEINSKYGTTLKNLSDETAFINQVNEAYQTLIKSIREKAAAEAGQTVLKSLFDKQIQATTFLENSITNLAKEAQKNPIILDVTANIEQLSPRLRILAQAYRNLDAERRVAVQTLVREQTAAIAEQERNATEFQNRGETLANQQSAAIRQIQQGLTEASQNQFIQSSAQVASDYESAANSFLQLTEEQQQLIEASDFKNAFDFFINQAIEADKGIKAVEGSVKKLITTATTAGGPGGGPNADALKNAQRLADAIAKLRLSLAREISGQELELKFQATLAVEPKTFEEFIQQNKDTFQKVTDEFNAEVDNRIEEARKEGTLTNEIAEQFAQLRKNGALIITGQQKAAELKIIEDFAKRQQNAIADIEKTGRDKRAAEIQDNVEKTEQQRTDLIKQLSKARTSEEREAIKKQLNDNLELLKAYNKQLETLTIAQIEADKKLALSDTKLTPEERQAIEADADLKIFNTKKDFAGRTQDLDETTTDATIAQNDKRVEAIKDGYKQIADEAFNLTKVLIDAEIQRTDAAIANQQRRVDAAKEIADQGNAELLEAEQARLDKLNQQRARFVKQQQALSFLEIAANSAIAISKAAAEGGIAAPLTIAATLIALAAGFAQARAQAESASSFAVGGYTGDGGKYERAGIVHRGEFVITKEKTKQFRPLLEAIHAGRNPMLNKGFSDGAMAVQNKSMESKLERIEKAIKGQRGLQLSIDERGINGIVSSISYKQNRIKNKAR